MIGLTLARDPAIGWAGGGGCSLPPPCQGTVLDVVDRHFIEYTPHSTL